MRLAVLGLTLMTAPITAADFPDPLVAGDGTKIATPEQWQSLRKPELKALFQKHMYGTLPQTPDKVEGIVRFEDKRAFGGIATLTEVELKFARFDTTNLLPVYLLVCVPNGKPGPVPAFVGPNFCGNHCLTTDERVRLPDAWMYPKYPGVVGNKATAAGRGKQMDVWPLKLAAERGYAVATFYNGDIQPDRPGESEGFRALPGVGDTATIMAWAWGVMRCVDYLTTRPDIDAKRIAAVGHSRLGKTVLLAAAFDDRIAMAIPHQAGCGGTGPSRHSDPKAESVKRITTAFPHWFCPAFAGYGDDPEKLPFDQHGLLALCAPRPVLYPNAAEDLWANPAGQFDMLKRATPVYKLLGVGGLEADAVPPHGELSAGRLGYFIRAGKHEMNTADWGVYLRFADKWLK